MNVEIVNLTKHFGSTRAVNGISFSFGSGQVVGFVGPNGAGKTTTMRILATLEDATCGDALIDGISVTEEPEKVRPLLGFVPDTLPTYGDTTVAEYLDFFARAYGLRGAARKQSVRDIEEFTDLAGLHDRLLRTLSKGMKQRVNLGRALIHNPELLILDEPAAGLDPRARVELRELLAILAARNKTILISSHILRELTEICNAVVIIERGGLLESGSIKDVAQRGRAVSIVVVRVRGREPELHRALLEWPGVSGVRQAGTGEFHVELEGEEEARGDLLADLVRRGFRIVEFAPRRADLEDIFMTVTKGGVQ